MLFTIIVHHLILYFSKYGVTIYSKCVLFLIVRNLYKLKQVTIIADQYLKGVADLSIGIAPRINDKTPTIATEWNERSLYLSN